MKGERRRRKTKGQVCDGRGLTVIFETQQRSFCLCWGICDKERDVTVTMIIKSDIWINFYTSPALPVQTLSLMPSFSFSLSDLFCESGPSENGLS